MEKKYPLKSYIEMAVPGIIGIVLLLAIPHQINLSHSLLTQSTSSQLFPKLTAWGLIVLTVFRFAHLWFSRHTGAETEGKKAGIGYRWYAGLATIAIYAALIPVLGFIVATLLNIIALMYVIESRTSWWKALIYSAVSTMLIWYIFDELISIPLPKGFMGI